MRKFRKQWLIFLLPIILCGCPGPMAPPIPLSTNEFTPSVNFYGYDRSETATFRGYLYRDSLLIDSCYFDYRSNGRDQDAYGERNPIDVITKLHFYNSEVVPDSIAYTDTLFIHTGHKIHKVYNMYYKPYREYRGRYPYALVYTVDGIEIHGDNFPILYKNGYWTPASSYKLLTKEFTPFINFNRYKRDEITTFKGYLCRSNYIVDSCNFKYLWEGGEDEYATLIGTRLHFYNSEMTPLDSIAYTDTLFMHIGDNIHKIYNIYNVLVRKKTDDKEALYSLKYTIDGIKTENFPIFWKNRDLIIH